MSKLKNKQTNNRVGNPYFIDKFSTIKPVYKIGFLKFWVAGASYFLAFMTLEVALRTDILDQLFVMFILMGLLTEYVTNKIIYHMNRSDQDTLQYLPFRKNVDRSKIVSLLLSFLYAFIMIGQALIIHTIWIEVLNVFGLPSIGGLLLGTQNSLDPISFGLYIWLLDLIWYKGRKVITKE